MGATLLEMAKNYKDPLAAGIVEMFAENSPILQVLPFEDVVGGGLPYNVEETLPGIGFRGVNEEWDQSIGVVNPQFEPLVIAGGELDFDNHILRTQGEGRRATETASKVKAMGLKWTQAFIHGDSSTNPRTFDGLMPRLRGRQLVSAGSTAGGSALSLFALDLLAQKVDNPTHYVANETIILRLSAAARDPNVGGYITWDKNQFGQRVMSFNGMPFLMLKRDNLNQDILPFAEVAAAGAATATSVYCVSLDEDHLHGIQHSDPIVEDLGDIKVKSVQRTRVEWDCGLVLRHPHGAARLWSVGNVPVVA